MRQSFSNHCSYIAAQAIIAAIIAVAIISAIIAIIALTCNSYTQCNPMLFQLQTN
jgi:hypothetical protein